MMPENLHDVLASCLEAIEQGQSTVETCLERYPEHRQALEALLLTALAVREEADFALRPGFRQASRARLLARLEPQQQARPFAAGQKASNWRFRAIAIPFSLVLLLVIVLSGVGTAYAATSALPGENLYPVKLAVEDTRLWMADDNQDVLLNIEFMQTRMAEIQALIETDRQDDLALVEGPYNKRINAAAQSLALVAQDDTEQAAELALLLDETLLVHTETLRSLLETVPEQARPAIEHAMQSSSTGQDVIRDLFGDGAPGGRPPFNDAPEHTPAPPGNLPGDGAPGETPAPPADLPGGGPPAWVTPGPPSAPGGRP